MSKSYRYDCVLIRFPHKTHPPPLPRRVCGAFHPLGEHHHPVPCTLFITHHKLICAKVNLIRLRRGLGTCIAQRRRDAGTQRNGKGIQKQSRTRRLRASARVSHSSVRQMKLDTTLKSFTQFVLIETGCLGAKAAEDDFLDGFFSGQKVFHGPDGDGAGAIGGEPIHPRADGGKGDGY